jgi:hypothetical protein
MFGKDDRGRKVVDSGKFITKGTIQTLSDGEALDTSHRPFANDFVQGVHR